MTSTDTDSPSIDPAAGRTSKVHRSLIELTGGQVFVVRVTMPDRLRWDMTAPRKNWGAAKDVPFLADSFVHWAAAKREGHYDGSWEDWSGRGDRPGDLVEITPITDDVEDVDRPTRPAPKPSLS